MHTPKTFGRKKGKSLSKKQQLLLESLLPRLNPSLIHPSEVAKIHGLEIGFGAGENLMHQAILNPDKIYIGCEVFENGIAKLLDEIEKQDIQNVSIYPGDARDYINNCPKEMFDVVFLLFADPWPKKGHHKRRFFNICNIKAICNVLKNNGIFWVASDHPLLQEHILTLLESPDCKGCFSTIDILEKRPSKQHIPLSKYEKKALEEGRTPRFYCLKKTPNH